VNADNPATIAVTAAYADLGATITGPTADRTLGFTTRWSHRPPAPIAMPIIRRIGLVRRVSIECGCFKVDLEVPRTETLVTV